MARTSFSTLPSEIIEQILLYVPPSSIAAFQRVSRGFNALVGPLLWRHQCHSLYRYWDPSHRIKEKFSSDIEAADWRTIFIRRQNVDRITDSSIDSILSGQIGRLEKFQLILDCGYDAKDALLRHLRTKDDADDVLARRYYSDAVLGCLHRIMAVKEWSKLKDREQILLERALGAFDMFVLHDREGDFDEISSCLDGIASKIQTKYSDLKEQSTRQRALNIALYLRTKNLTGLKDINLYHDLQNNFLGIALQDAEHPSLPLISTAVYCSVAKRLGVDASACGFPFHVIAIVKPPAGFDLDGNPLVAEINSPQVMYMDLFRSADETPAADLEAQLGSLGASQTSHAHLMGPAPVAEIILRTAGNILNSVQGAHRNAVAQNGHGGPDHMVLISSFPDMDSAFYGALWASLLLGIPQDGDGPVVATVRRRNYLPRIVEHFETHFPNDVSLIEQYIVPLFQNSGEYAQLREAVRMMRAGDSMPKTIKSRNHQTSGHVHYKVGQVFQHRRYDYTAVITGWDVECGADEHWITQMRIHELPRGRHQSFYHVLVEDKSVRYVAEENIEIITPEMPASLMHLAGRHFKRWDAQSRCFVSNIKDEYPDD